jgi:hypothetical protein
MVINHPLTLQTFAALMVLLSLMMGFTEMKSEKIEFVKNVMPHDLRWLILKIFNSK